jgi:DNA-3-methyladenine glycosylase II
MNTSKTFSAKNFHALCDKICAVDTDLALIIKEHGYPPMWSRPNSLDTLVHFILEQQVSLASALAALNKLREKTGGITVSSILKLSDEEMRACYVSRQKMVYIRGIAETLQKRELDFTELEGLSNESVRERLIPLKGIGNWTVDVYLMFVLHRADVFPIGDLAAVNAVKRAKRLQRDASKEVVLQTAEKWQPYRTIATMILWHHYLSSPIKHPKSKAVGAKPKPGSYKAAKRVK